MIFFVMLGFQYTGNAACMVLAVLERTLKKAKKQYVLYNAPSCVAPMTALDTQFVPAHLSQRSCDALTSKFLELDRSLPLGFTRLLFA